MAARGARAAAGGAGDRENIMSNGSSLSLPELEDRIAIIGADTSIQNDSGLPQGLAVCTGTRDSPGATALAQLNGGND
jgi:hypothetical protein